MANNGSVAPAVAVRNLKVVRGGRTVIPGLDVTVERGQVVGLLGPSGCGKTTLLRAIVGVQIVADGDVEVFGQPAGRPRTSTSPPSTIWTPTIARMSVVLPQPLGPRRPTT